MSYRIQYEKRPASFRRWGTAGLYLVALGWCAACLGPVWQSVAAGEGLYDALARLVGGMILGKN